MSQVDADREYALRIQADDDRARASISSPIRTELDLFDQRLDLAQTPAFGNRYNSYQTPRCALKANTPVAATTTIRNNTVSAADILKIEIFLVIFLIFWGVAFEFYIHEFLEF